MVDTGATASVLPEFGQVATDSKLKLEKANVLVTYGDGSHGHIDKKTTLNIRPSKSSSGSKSISFHISNERKDLFGFEAIIGLPTLKLFDLSISFADGKALMIHQNKVVGHEAPTVSHYAMGLKVVDKFSDLRYDHDIMRLLRKYKVVFGQINDKPIKGEPMRFHTVHNKPIFANQRHYNRDEVLAMKKHIDQLLVSNIIERSNSGYAATSRIIPKKDGSGRLVINYIPLNSVTYRDSYTLPHLSDILTVLQGKHYFSTMDCAQGFYQIEIDPRDRHKTGFSTPFGNFQFRRCPFGARNSCAKFQAEMNRIFHDGLYTKCVIYVDDIMVFGETREEHDLNLEWVLKRAAEYNVKIKLEKCKFALNEANYLGFRISGQSIKPLEDQLDKLSNLTSPKTKTELRSVLGQFNFYSKFIPNYSKQLEPLRSLLTKNQDFQWRQFHQNALESLKASVKASNWLHLVDRNEPKIMMLRDAIDSFEVLLITEDRRLVIRANRLLSTTESNYSIIERHLLALVFGVEKFKIFLEPDKFTIQTALKQLKTVLEMKHRPDRVESLLLKIPEGFDDLKIIIDDTIPLHLAKKSPAHVAEEIFYVDGSCRDNGKQTCRASWGVCAEFDTKFERKGELSGVVSNQRAELMAAIKACYFARERGHETITIVTDSSYLYNAATIFIDK